MCDKKYKIDRETFSQLYEYVFTEQFEMCGQLKKNQENELKINNIESGNMRADKSGDMRHSCQASNIDNLPYYFHTHPFESRSYPSSEDILKLLKRPHKYIVSIIATRWGIYILRQSEQSLKNPLKDETNQITTKKKISDIIRWIGQIENNKGYKNNNYERELTTVELNEINKNITNLINLTYLKIKFCTWSSLDL
jgi:hypothetical protein